MFQCSQNFIVNMDDDQVLFIRNFDGGCFAVSVSWNMTIIFVESFCLMCNNTGFVSSSFSLIEEVSFTPEAGKLKSELERYFCGILLAFVVFF